MPLRCSVNVHLCGAPCKLRGKNGCLEECAKVGVYRALSLLLLMTPKVSGHEDDDHQCAAVTHACGEVAVTVYLLQYYMLYLTLPAVRSLHVDARRQMVQMRREVQNLSVSAPTAVASVIQSLTSSVTLSTKVTNVMHSIVPYLVNFASDFARVLTICMRWKKTQFIFVGM
jgi:hypothetical protein